MWPAWEGPALHSPHLKGGGGPQATLALTIAGGPCPRDVRGLGLVAVRGRRWRGLAGIYVASCGLARPLEQGLGEMADKVAGTPTPVPSSSLAPQRRGALSGQRDSLCSQISAAAQLHAVGGSRDSRRKGPLSPVPAPCTPPCSTRAPGTQPLYIFKGKGARSRRCARHRLASPLPPLGSVLQLPGQRGAQGGGVRA